jgi:hypothetical protein
LAVLAITATLFTTFWTNPAGLGIGFVGSLGYWLSQQGWRAALSPGITTGSSSQSMSISYNRRISG